MFLETKYGDDNQFVKESNTIRTFFYQSEASNLGVNEKDLKTQDRPLVIIVHGYTDESNEWSIEMKNKIMNSVIFFLFFVLVFYVNFI